MLFSGLENNLLVHQVTTLVKHYQQLKVLVPESLNVVYITFQLRLGTFIRSLIYIYAHMTPIILNLNVKVHWRESLKRSCTFRYYF